MIQVSSYVGSVLKYMLTVLVLSFTIIYENSNCTDLFTSFSLWFFFVFCLRVCKFFWNLSYLIFIFGVLSWIICMVSCIQSIQLIFVKIFVLCIISVQYKRLLFFYIATYWPSCKLKIMLINFTVNSHINTMYAIFFCLFLQVVNSLNLCLYKFLGTWGIWVWSGAGKKVPKKNESKIVFF